MSTSPAAIREVPAKIWKYFLLPALIYFIGFVLLTFPLILDFQTHYFTDDGDGLMGVWNLWWVDHVMTHPGGYSSVWRADMIHQPYGITLLGHTLSPVNGFIAAVLNRFLPLLETHNVIVIFSFVMSGLTAYWLAYHFSESRPGSLAAGYLFAFSAYHFAHYDGHLNLITVEWIPLFALCFYRLVTKPGVWIGLGAALALWLVQLSDLYYLFYCLLLAILILFVRAVEKRNLLFFLKNDYAAPFGTFAAVSILLLAPAILPLVYLSIRDPFLGGHDPLEFSLDLYSIFIPGERWRFSELTRPFWGHLPGDPAEISVFPGWSWILSLLYLIFARKYLDDDGRRQMNLWVLILCFFILMALGPTLQIGGNSTGILMPYALLERAIPFIRLSGVPARMIVMAVLAGSVLCAMAFRELALASPRRGFLSFILLLLVVVESLPAPLPSTKVETPAYVEFLAGLPEEDETVLDLAAPTQYLHLYYQTLHEKPLVFGYTARIPASLYKREKAIKDAIGNGDYRKLREEYGIRYVATREQVEAFDPSLDVRLIFDEAGVRIYRLEIR